MSPFLASTKAGEWERKIKKQQLLPFKMSALLYRLVLMWLHMLLRILEKLLEKGWLKDDFTANG